MPVFKNEFQLEKIVKFVKFFSSLLTNLIDVKTGSWFVNRMLNRIWKN